MAKKNKDLYNDKITGIFLFIVVAIIPLIVRQSIIDVSMYEYGIIRASSQIADVFSYAKAVMLCVVAVLLLIYKGLSFITSIDFKINFDFKNKAFILAMIYTFFCIISTLFSSYKYVAVNGVTERYEGLLVILSYMLFFVVSLDYARNTKQLKYIFYGICVSAFLIGTVGLFQYFGFDIFKTDLMARLVQGGYYSGAGLNVKFDKVYATLYNPNCVGLYSAMLFPFMLVLALTAPIKNFKKYIYIVLTLLTGVLVVGSGSLGGFLGVATSIIIVAIIAIIYFFVKKVYTRINIKLALPIAVVAIIICALGASVFVKKADIIQKLEVVISAINNPELLDNPNFYESMSIDGQNAIINTKSGEVKLVADGDNIDLKLNDTLLSPISEAPLDNGMVGVLRTYNISGLKKAELQISGDNVFLICYDQLDNPTHFMFKNTGNSFEYLDKFGKEITGDIKAIGFEGIERLGSSRGYIWSRTLPLVASNIFIGEGPDTFSLVFPQEDTVGKLTAFGNPYVIVDKPHNMFLQIAIDTGLLSLLAVLALVLLFIIQTISKIFKNTEGSFIFGLRWACLAAVIGYMVAATTTDSVVSVSPIFWVLLGMGFAINYIKLQED